MSGDIDKRSGARRTGGYHWDSTTLEQRRRARLQRLEAENYTQLPEFDNLTIAVETTKGHSNSASGMVKSTTSAITIGTATEGLKRLNRRETRHLMLQRRTFADMLNETDIYWNCLASPGNTPVRHFCSICGYKGIYTCVECGIRYCSLACRSIHVDTRCLKYVV